MPKDSSKFAKRARLFFFLWLSSIAVFISIIALITKGVLDFNKNNVNNVAGLFLFLGDILFGVICFVLTAYFLKHYLKRRKIEKIFEPELQGSGSYKYLLLVGCLLLFFFLAYQKNGMFDAFSAKKDSIATIPPIVVVTPSPIVATPVPTINAKTTKVMKVNNDPIVDCGPGQNSKQYVKDKASNCKNYVDCGLENNVWTLMLKAECDKKHGDMVQHYQQTSGTGNSQPTSGNNVYCYNNAYGYSYYTSSGDQCNLDNIKATTRKICMDAQKSKVNSCDNNCKSDSQSNSAMCSWAYTGPNAAIEQNGDKYGECLNGSGGLTELFSSCLSKCSAQYVEDIKQCN